MYIYASLTGILQTTVNASIDHVGTLLTYAAHAVTATYSDELPKSLSECVLRLRSIGEVSASSANALPLHPITLTVTDADLNIDSYSSQIVLVNVTDGFKISHHIQLLETGLDSAQFTGTISISLNPLAAHLGEQSSHQPTLLFLSRINDVVHISYSDTSPVGIRTPPLAIRVGQRGLLEAQPLIVSTVSSIIGAHGINVTVTDADLNIDAGAIEQHHSRIKVHVLSGSVTLRTASVNLTETSSNSSVFTGAIRTLSAGSVVDPQSELGLNYLTGISASPVVIEYEDPTGGVAMQSVTLQTERRGMSVRVCVCMFACVHTCVRACAHTCVCTCERSCAFVQLHTRVCNCKCARV